MWQLVLRKSREEETRLELALDRFRPGGHSVVAKGRLRCGDVSKDGSGDVAKRILRHPSPFYCERDRLRI